MGGLNNRNMLLIVLEAEKSESQVLTDPASGEDCLSACGRLPSHSVLTWRGEGEGG